MTSRLEDVFAQRVRAVASERGLPLSHVADRAGIARSHFWLLLDGTVSTSLGVVQRIAEVLQVPALDLLRDAPAVGPIVVRATSKRTPREASYAAANPVKASGGSAKTQSKPKATTKQRTRR